MEVPNVATSDAPFGTVGGVQLAAVFQSPIDWIKIPSSAAGLSVQRKRESKAKKNEEFDFHRLFIGVRLSYGTTMNVRSFPSPPW